MATMLAGLRDPCTSVHIVCFIHSTVVWFFLFFLEKNGFPGKPRVFYPVLEMFLLKIQISDLQNIIVPL